MNYAARLLRDATQSLDKRLGTRVKTRLGDSYRWFLRVWSRVRRVVDTGKTCEIGLSLFEGEERIHFHSELPSLSEVDLVFLNSPLQYIPDWAELLSKLVSYRPKYFLMVRLDAGEIPTHARGQRSIKGSTIPYWCLNIQTVLKTMSELRYSLLFKSSGPTTYDENNLPQNYRLGHYCNLLFCQTDAAMPNQSSGSSS